ncbi:MAG: alpha amylase C-terminal domain-containing protein, partial [Desulfobacterota bacterium]|nr:alpha amylase C-terminal domain-containing protein [Thermodesulfobacteriota bacterium]
PIHRKYHHNQLTFLMLYALHENFILPLSHDEVVHGKGSLLHKMPGDEWQKFANLRLLFGYMYGQPGKKLLFMGGEFGQGNEWYHEVSLDWHLLEYKLHQGLQLWIKDLNCLYCRESALHQSDFENEGFSWIDCQDSDNSTLSWLRQTRYSQDLIMVIANFTPVPRLGYQVGVPRGGLWEEVLNSDAIEYGGSGQGNWGRVEAVANSWHGQSYSLNLTLPPLGILFFRSKG